MPGWAWLVLGFVLLASELASPSGFYLLFAGIGAIIVGLLGLGELSGPPWAQWLLFTLISVLSVVTLRSRMVRSFNKADAMLSSPRSPSITIRIFSWAENRRRVLRRISRTAFSADAFFSMDPFSSRSPEPSLRSSVQSVQTPLMAYRSRRDCRFQWKGGAWRGWRG